MIEKYEKYLEILNNRLLEKAFIQQKDYLFCKPKCSHCCEIGEYPFSKIEFEYAMIGFNNLSEEQKTIIKEKVKQVKEQQKNINKEEKFLYECPFLIDKMCSIYSHRGLVCRTHGLMFYRDENGERKHIAPACMDIGLNYSNVYDKNTETVSEEMWIQSGIKTEPIAYNLSLKFLLNSKLAKQLDLDFGEEKSIIDWLE